jgi:hypothetical protein
MELQALAASICDQADTILDHVTTRAEAKEDITEWLTVNHPKLSPADKKTVVSQVLSILDSEDFFKPGPVEPDSVDCESHPRTGATP